MYADAKEDIDMKISVLRDFRLLDRRCRRKERQIREILGRCISREQMDNKLHDVLAGRTTLDALIIKECRIYA